METFKRREKTVANEITVFIPNHSLRSTPNKSLSIPHGRRPIPTTGLEMAMLSFVLMSAAPGKALESSIPCLGGHQKLSSRSSNGVRSSRGPRARSDCWESPTMLVRSGVWAARQPKGLAAMIPWEGMSDYYRDRCRHGGILSNQFISFWWNRQVITNQYGRPGRKAANWGPDTIEGDLSEDELRVNRQDQTVDNIKYKFRDEDYYASKDFRLEDVKVPLLSVANWGGILLHLRGNVQGFMHAGSDLKYLRFITGRHDLPFYYSEEVELQRSFLDAFLKGVDNHGWNQKGKLPPVSLVLRKGDVGFNDAQAEKVYERRSEMEWPISRTQYTKYYLTPDLELLDSASTFENTDQEQKVNYPALGTLSNPQVVQFTTPPFRAQTEITGHIVTHLCVSASAAPDADQAPSDIDLFLTLRHLSPEGKEVFYTGTAGDPVPLTKGWLRVSLRKVDTDHPYHREWLPHREYRSTDVQEVKPNSVYEVDIELWPTNVVVQMGGRLVLEVASGDTQGKSVPVTEGLDSVDSIMMHRLGDFRPQLPGGSIREGVCWPESRTPWSRPSELCDFTHHPAGQPLSSDPDGRFARTRGLC